jgi:WD40 repeat protein
MTGKALGLAEDLYRRVDLRNRPTAMTHSPDGKHLATAHSDGKVTVTRVEDGAVVYEHKEKAGPIAFLVFSPDGKRLAWATPEGEIRLVGFDAWKTDIDRLQAEIRALEQRLKRMTDLVSEARTEAERAQYQAQVERAARLLSEQLKQDQAMRERARAEEQARLAERAFYYQRLSRAADNLRLGDHKDTLKLLEEIPRPQRQWEWRYLRNTVGGAEPSRKLVGHTAAVRALAVAPDGKRFASAGEDGSLRFWESNGKAVLSATQQKGPIDGLSFSRDGRQLASVNRDGILQVLDAATGKKMYGFTDPVVFPSPAERQRGNSAVSYSPDNKLLAIKNSMTSLKVLDAASGKVVGQVAEPRSTANSLSYSPNNNMLAVCGAGVSPTLLNPTNGAKVRVLLGDSKDAKVDYRSVAFSSDGRQLAAVALANGAVHLWDVQTGKLTMTLKGHPRPACAAFSPDGKRIATGGDDNTVKVWDLATGQSLLTLTGHTKPVTCVAFTPDGASLISGSLDQTLRVWPGNQAK